VPVSPFSVLATAALLGAGHGSYVRVNQAGYPTSAPKRAYLMANVAEPRATFSVYDRYGRAAYTARVGPDLGRWSAAYPHVYALDFGRLRGAGDYAIAVNGPGPAASPRFEVGPAARLYRQPLANALSYYQVSRDGPDFVPSPLHTAASHLNDRDAMTYLTPKTNDDGNFKGDLAPLGIRIDASGGWADAGDYPKFVETTSYTVDMLLAGVRDFPAQMGGFAAEGRFGVDWLGRMWDDSTRTLYYQVGIGSGNSKIVADHDIWRLPQADDSWGGSDPRFRYIRNRPVFRAAPPGSRVSPNIAGRDAAAFALCYQVFRTSDPAFAARCLSEGEHIFALADTHPKGNLLTVVPFDFYGETEWRDDMELGATELAQATRVAGGDPLPYLRQATRWARAYIDGPNDAADTLNLYDVSGLAHYELARALGSRRGLPVTRAALVADIRKQLDRALAQSRKDPFQFGFPWSTWDTTTHGAGLSVMAGEYDELTHSRTFAAWSGRWLANILGANAWGTSLIVGDGTTFPRCLQHQQANLIGSRYGGAPVLAGAAVEGPNSFSARGVVAGMRRCPPHGGDDFARFDSATAVYRDDVQSYSNVEPAIDLTASSPLAFARQAAGRY
jgi:endoglucanase